MHATTGQQPSDGVATIRIRDPLVAVIGIPLQYCAATLEKFLGILGMPGRRVQVEHEFSGEAQVASGVVFAPDEDPQVAKLARIRPDCTHTGFAE